MGSGAGLKVDGGVSSQLANVVEAATTLERRGYDGCWTAEINHDPFLPLTLAAEHTDAIELGTSIAVAFARNPMTVANVGWDLQEYSGGRLNLGLGSQIQPHIEKRFSMPWSRPVPRMREFVLAMREIWTCWRDGSKLGFEGDFYTHKLMTPMFTPEPHDYDFPKVFVAAVGEAMTEMAGEVADGVLAHAFTTKRYFEEVTHAGTDAGDDPIGSAAQRLPGVVSGVRGHRARRVPSSAPQPSPPASRSPSTGRPPPTARSSNCTAGGRCRTSCAACRCKGDWDGMGALIDDEVLEAFAVVAPIDKLAAKIRDRCDGVIDRVMVGFPRSIPDETVKAVLQELRGRTAQ